MAFQVLLALCLVLASGICQVAGGYLQIELNGVYSHQTVPDLDLTPINWITFTCLGYHDVILSLQGQASGIYTNSYEITLGGLSNTLSYIRTHIGSPGIPPYVATYPGGIVSGTAQTDFWVSWASGIKVGTGTVVSSASTILSISPNLLLYKVRALTVTSFAARVGISFNLLAVSTNTIQITTDDNPTYHRLLNLDVSMVTSSRFSVMACIGAYVRLEASYGATAFPVYEFLIGGVGNTNQIVIGGVAVASVTAPTLACMAPKAFWILWGGGILKFGVGTVVGSGTLAAYTAVIPYVVAGLSVRTIGGMGDWIVTY